MIRTFFGLDALSSPQAFFAALAIGVVFGFALERAGFGSSRRLAGIFYFRDMTVLKVMFTAVITAMIGLAYFVGFGLVEINQIYLMPSVYGAQIVGGLIFGVGFVIGGWCPGTAAVGTAAGKIDALVFLGGALLGSIAYNELYPLISPLASWGASGTSTVYAALGMSSGAFGLLFTLVAIGCFWGAEKIERKVSGTGRYLGSRFLKVFSVAMIALALGAAVLGTGAKSSRNATASTASLRADEAAILKSVEEARDHIDPEELAGRMFSGEKGLLVIDVRPAREFESFHLRGAVNVRISGLFAYLAPRKNRGLVVLYSNGMTHPAQARDALARAGHTNVYMLTDGLNGFIERCLKPVSLRSEPTDETTAARINAWRRYFADFHSPPAGPRPSPRPSARATALPSARFPGLANASWLAANASRKDLKVIDVRAQKEYNGGHIPGSLALNPESLRGNAGGVPSLLLPAESLAAIFGAMGIGPEDTVVLVSRAARMRDATLAAMALERLGHASFAILEGGFEAWTSAGGATDTRLPVVVARNYPIRKETDGFTVNAQTVLADSRKRTKILDVRPADYYSGKKQDEARGGHIPGAVSRPYTEDLNDSGFRGVAELSAAYARILGSRESPVIVHCRTGHQASQTYFVLKHVLGYRNVRWYDGGWTEWASRPELPVDK